MKDFMRIICKIKMVFELLILLSWLFLAGSESLPSLAKPGCQKICGNTSIAYPFGIGSRCYHNQWFKITCNSSFNPPKPYLTKLNLEVLGIRLASQTVKVNIPMTVNCTKGESVTPWKSLDLGGSPFSFSRRFNAFIPVGCSGSSISYYENQVMASCGHPVCANRSLYNNTDEYYIYEGICHASRPPNDLTSYRVNITEANGTCHYVSLMEININEADGTFRYVSLTENDPNPAPVVLNWLYDLSLDPTSTAFLLQQCDLYAYLNTGVYHCSCPYGQVGNPYLPNGCQVPEECKHCPRTCVTSADDMNSYHCESFHGRTALYIVGIPATFVFSWLLPLISCCWIVHCIVRQRKRNQRVKFFKQSGGLLLQQQLSNNGGAVERTRIFTISVMEKATDHFSKNRILGQGGQGTVYKGMLADGTTVAIKKSKLVDESQVEQFINEVVILSQINHRNVVKLLGCCLETEVPLLVYEFIPNGTLSQHIHDPDDDDFVINWEMRLKIAADSAGAIAYLHSSSSSPIYHRDIKSSNILLDGKHRAKVSDFGCSKTIAVDQTHLTTLVKGTWGYFDPEYFQTHQFTDKSDVYSFGVLLVELLTSKKSIYTDESTMEPVNLASQFLLLMGNSSLSHILDPKIVKDAKEEELMAVSELARRCLNGSGRLRPSMKEVASTLEMIIKSSEEVPTLDEQAVLYEEFGESMAETETSDAEFVSTPLPVGAESPLYIDVQPILPNTI